MEETTTTRSEKWRERLKKTRQWLRRASIFGSGVLAAFMGLLIYNQLFPPPHAITPREVKDTVVQVMASATPPPAFSALVYQAIQPSLVLIETKGTNNKGGSEEALGSGVIIDDRGDILTCLHVVADATQIQITFADGTQSEGVIASRQPENDIAVLQAVHPPAQIIPATLGNPRSVRVGDEAYVVGNPFGLYSSMSAGVISGFNRTFQPTGSDKKLEGLIQIDAAVNPGNSGGPLLNRYGEVIGIVEGIVTPGNQEFFIGIGFAVPINVAGGGLGSPPD
jgi:S1-C subfamily serine protease